MSKTLRHCVIRWNEWSQGSVNRRIFANMITVGSFGFVVALSAAAKELIVANQFGTSDSLDAFLMAFLLPSLVINVVTGSFHAAFIPEYIKVQEKEGVETARQLCANILAFNLVVLLVISLFLASISSLIIPALGSRFNPQKLDLTQSLFSLLLPLLIVSGLTKAWGSILNAGERFGLAAISPIIIHISAIVLLLWKGSEWGIYALVFGTACGFILEAGVLFWVLWSQGLAVFPQWKGFDQATKKIILQYVPMVAGTFLMAGTMFVDQVMAAMLSPGSVSTLNYGYKVVGFILGSGSIALSTAIFPHFSQMVALGDWDGIRHTLKTYSRLILIASIPLTLILFFFSEPLVQLVFERGAFTGSNTNLVGKVQAYYFLQLPFYVLGMLGVRLLSAMGKNHILMAISGINLVVNIIGNYMFVGFFGVAGIGLSTSVVYAGSTTMIFISLFKHLKEGECSSAL